MTDSALIISTLALLGVLYIGGAIFYIYLRRITKKREQLKAELTQKYASTVDHHIIFPVRAANKKRFETICKLFPWEQSGIILVDKDIATLILVNAEGEESIHKIDRQQTPISWFGAKLWPNGGLCWFTVEINGQLFYLTSETGMTIVNSKSSTELIFNNLTSSNQSQPIMTGQPDFALEKHPLTLTLAILLIAFMAYSIVDSFLNTERYIHYPFYWLSALVFVVAGGVSSLFVFKSKVPNKDGITLSVVFALILAWSAHPLMLRINQLTDTQGIIHYEYTYDGVRFKPAISYLPEVKIDTSRTNGYWAQFDADYVHVLPLRKGGLGFYQLDMKPINEATFAFYKKQEEAVENN